MYVTKFFNFKELTRSLNFGRTPLEMKCQQNPELSECLLKKLEGVQFTKNLLQTMVEYFETVNTGRQTTPQVW